jgi:hypothetical protein
MGLPLLKRLTNDALEKWCKFQVPNVSKFQGRQDCNTDWDIGDNIEHVCNKSRIE